MDKRYQVFVSSTFSDLSEERERVMKSLMDLGCIPAGMELFPAADEEQMSYIKTVIDDSDYYLLIIGGRYGSLSPSGLGYTELEYNYAVETGKPVVALLHNDLENLPVSRSERVPAQRKKLDAFRAKVSKNRLVRFWKTADELAERVSTSMSQVMARTPAIGWVRGNSVASVELLTQMVDIQKENANLKEEIKKLRAVESIQPDVRISFPGGHERRIGRADVKTERADSSRPIGWGMDVYFEISNIGSVTAHDIYAFVIFPPDCYVYEAAPVNVSGDGWSFISKKDDNKVIIAGRSLVHGIGMSNSHPFHLLFPEKDKEYELTWSVNASNLRDPLTGRLLITPSDREVSIGVIDRSQLKRIENASG